VNQRTLGPGGAKSGGIESRLRACLRRAAAPLVLAAVLAPRVAHAACAWGWPVGDAPGSPAPLEDNHPVGGMNLPEYGAHLGADFWSGGGCTDLGQPVYAMADGEVVEIADDLGSYLDVVVLRHEDPGVGTVYSMYGHIARDPALAEGQRVTLRQPLGTIADVLQYFSPCHTHVEILSPAGFDQGPFCNGCAAAGLHVSPGYDQQAGVSMGTSEAGDPYLEVDDGVAANRWYHVDPFVQARLGAVCGACGDGSCDAGESFDACPDDCDPCALIPPAGGVLDDAGPCFSFGGDPQYWVVESGVGYADGLRWTHATDSASVDNWGEWAFAFQEGGTYRLEVWTAGGFAQSTMAAYVVAHEGGEETVVVDQSSVTDGWLALGDFSFAAGGGQSLRLADNTGEPFSQMVRLAFDAVRIERLDAIPGDDGTSDGGAVDGTGAGSPDDGATTVLGDGDGTAGSGDGSPGSLPGLGRDAGSGGCACTLQRRRTPAPLALALVVLAVLGRRRAQLRGAGPGRYRGRRRG
jgi:hypothetical protein